MRRSTQKRLGRPTKFTPALGAALIDLTLNENLSIRHAAKQVGISQPTIYNWLERAKRPRPPRGLVKWAKDFTWLHERAAEDWHRERWIRYRREAKARYQAFKASREAWWRRQLGERAFWLSRLLWLLNRGHEEAAAALAARLRAEGVLSLPLDTIKANGPR